MLAHSHSWQGEKSDPVGNVEKALAEGMHAVEHPRELLDVVCVADLATWWAFKVPWLGPPRTPMASWQSLRESLWPYHPAEGCVQTQLNRHDSSLNGQHGDSVNPLMVLMTVLLRRIAWEEPGLRPIASYFEKVAKPVGGGPTRLWDNSVYSPDVWAQIAWCGSPTDIGDHWGQLLM